VYKGTLSDGTVVGDKEILDLGTKGMKSSAMKWRS